MNFLCFFLVIGTVFKLYSREIISFKEPRDALKIVKPYLPANPVILEAGSYNGADSVYLTKFWPEATIYSFEPLPQIYADFCKRTHKYKNIKGFNSALGDSCGKKQFYVSTNSNSQGKPSESSSLLAPKEHLFYAPHIVFNEIIDVDCLTIDTWAQENNITHIDLMWLDMQGNELETLQASPYILKNVKAIITEVEFVEAYEGQSLYKAVKEWIESQGFTMIALSKTAEWFGDAVFVRI